MKPHPRGTELKVGTTRNFTQPAAEVEAEAELDKAHEQSVPAQDGTSLSVPTTGQPEDI